jgi:hypothetical protein
MAELMSNGLAMQFNFYGHGTKHGFKNLLLKDVVNGKVCSNNDVVGMQVFKI